MKLFNKPVKPSLKTPMEMLEIGGLYEIEFINQNRDMIKIGPFLYLGFGQDEEVEYMKTGYIFLDVKDCRKFCESSMPPRSKLIRLDIEEESL